MIYQNLVLPFRPRSHADITVFNSEITMNVSSFDGNSVIYMSNV